MLVFQWTCQGETTGCGRGYSRIPECRGKYYEHNTDRKRMLIAYVQGMLNSELKFSHDVSAVLKRDDRNEYCSVYKGSAASCFLRQFKALPLS